MKIMQSIQNRIYTLRGERVMLDFDLAALYEVETKVLNQAVKRNIKRFSKDFMFRLTVVVWEWMRSQIVTASEHAGDLRPQIVTSNQDMSSQFVMTSQNKRNTGITPYAFTEQAVAMLSSILKSGKAINMDIAIMRAFVEVRKVLLLQTDLKEQLKELREKLGEHDIQLNQIYDAMENLLDEKAVQRKWDERERIGFKK